MGSLRTPSPLCTPVSVRRLRSMGSVGSLRRLGSLENDCGCSLRARESCGRRRWRSCCVPYRSWRARLMTSGLEGGPESRNTLCGVAANMQPRTCATDWRLVGPAVYAAPLRSAQKFCSTRHRQAFWIAARRWTMRAIETPSNGRLLEGTSEQRETP